jgi:hypothetical protein
MEAVSIWVMYTCEREVIGAFPVICHLVVEIRLYAISMYIISRLGGVMVSVLATGPMVRGFKPGRGDGFLRAIKIRNTPSFGVPMS